MSKEEVVAPAESQLGISESQLGISESQLGISESQLEQLLVRVIAAVKEPTALEQKKIDKEQKKLLEDNQSRLELSGQVKAKNDNEQAYKTICSHKHRTGQSHGVFIQDGNYIHCQECHANIRPGESPEGYTGRDIYDTTLFNRVWQELPTNEMFG